MDRSSARQLLRIVSQCIVSAALALGCAPSAKKAPSESVESTDSEVVVCNEWTSIDNRELYVLPPMNRMLGYYPDFADYAGLDSVSNCDDGRQFVAAFEAYSALHPNFNADLPLGEIAGPEPVPDAPPQDAQKSKIFGGSTPGSVFNWAYPAASIVLLDDKFGNPLCTGTFIAKNWILTAAHCLSTVPSSGTTLNGLRGYTDWIIEWPNSGGDIDLSVSLAANHVLQIPHPDFISKVQHDTALLFLHPLLFDQFLPGRPDQGAAMRISGFAATDLNHHTGDPTITTSFAGYGGNTQVLLISDPADSVVTSSGEGLHDYTITLTSDTQDGTCHGDSGGPLFARVPPQLFPPEAGVPANTPVALELGVFSAFGRPPDHDCALRGEPQIWTRIDGAASLQNTLDSKSADFLFIQQTLRKWYFTPFACRAGKYVGHSTIDLALGFDDYFECWGKPCQQQADCGDAAYCSYPKSSFAGKSCLFCQTGCDCVFGQCLPIPSTTPTCSDALRNGDETDVDCGGSCPGCAFSRKCLVDSDCEQKNCVTGLCR